MCKIEAIAAFVAALLVGACDSSPDSTIDSADTAVHGDTSQKGDNPEDDTIATPIQTVFQVRLVNPILDGELQIAIFEDGTPERQVQWTTVTDGVTEFMMSVLVGDTCVVKLDYRGGNFTFEQRVTITGQGEPVVAPLDVLAALPCVRYADVEDYLWTCEDTVVKNDDDFYVMGTGDQCTLWRDGMYANAPEGQVWIYQGPGRMSVAFCDPSLQDSYCWRNCTGIPPT